jgi:hypothetical protein
MNPESLSNYASPSLLTLSPIHLVTLSFLVLSGCSSSGPTVVPVSGKVTLDGQPLVNASISFQPITRQAEGAHGIGSYGKTDAEGKYTLRLIDPDQPGALVGRHQVSVTTAVAANPASDELKVKSPERLPAAARTREFAVPASGTDQANFELTSK